MIKMANKEKKVKKFDFIFFHKFIFLLQTARDEKKSDFRLMGRGVGGGCAKPLRKYGKVASFEITKVKIRGDKCQNEIRLS